MRSRARFVYAVVVGLMLAGCGGTKKAATAAPTSSVATPTTTTNSARPPVKSVSYRIKLVGGKRAPNGSGLAVININGPTNELCWIFSQFQNVTAPTEASTEMHIDGHSEIGISMTPLGKYQESGCAREPPLLLGVIEANPTKFVVTVENEKHPERAVTGRL